MKFSLNRLTLALASMALTASCSTSDSPGTSPGSGGSGGKSMTAGSGGSGPAGGTGGSPAGGSGGTTTGGTGGQGGSAPAGSGGNGGGAGGNSGSGGSSGSGDAGTEMGPLGGGLALVGKLEKTLFKATIGRYDPDGRSGCFTGATVMAMRNQRNEDTIKGEPTKTYDVTFRVQGLAEPRHYDGGRTDPSSPFINIGGTPNTGGGENRAQYINLRVEVSDPKEVYHLNRFHGDHRDHEVYPMDYKLTVKAKGGATIAAILTNPNMCCIANHRNRTVEGVPAEVITQPFKDQFLYITAESVVEAP